MVELLERPVAGQLLDADVDEVRGRGPVGADDPRGRGYGFEGLGHYEESYRKVDGEWKIASLRLTRLWTRLLTEQSGPGVAGAVSSIGRDWLGGLASLPLDG